MAATRLRVAVVGVGGAGSAACYYLARDGAEVVGYEQFVVGHTRGSSHGESRIIRYTYPDRLYTAMMSDAYALWADVEKASGAELFVRCGGLYFGPKDHPEMAAVKQSLDDCGLPYETLDPEEAAARHPALRLAPGSYALCQPESGFLRAGRCVRTHAELARARGASIREGVTVTGIDARSGGVLVRTSAGDEEVFDRVIVTAGPWMGELFADLRLPLCVTRQEIVYLTPQGERDDYRPGRLPVWIDAETHWYGFPADGVLPGVKLALHHPGPPADPDQPTPDASENAALSEQGPEAAAGYAGRRLPGLTLPATHTTTCLYTNTPDEDFILDTVPDLPDVYLVSGCSGHGFKFTTLLGKIAADWAQDQPYPRDLSRFRLSRFLSTSVTTA